MTHPLKAYRKDKGITLAALARVTGLSKSHLSLIENGRPAGRRTIEALSAFTGLSPLVFFHSSSPGVSAVGDGARLGEASISPLSSPDPETSKLEAE